jgi:uncharacterized protein
MIIGLALPSLHQIVDIIPFILAGFLAQLVDGALGMAFGVISSTLLVALVGVQPKQASASIHLVELFTTGASGISHVLHKNVDWKLFFSLAIPGIIGGILGAYVLSSVDAKVAKPFVMTYLACIGVYLLYKAIHFDDKKEFAKAKVTAPLGLLGGFLDAAGGGGWGPVVTSNLLIQNTDPRKTIGTVNTVEFFVTMAISATFIFTIGLQSFTLIIVGLLIGGLLAAPFGALLAKNIKPKTLLLLVGCVLTITSVYNVYRAIGG